MTKHHMKRIMAPAIAVIAFAMCITGCRGTTERLDRREERDPLLRRAQAHKRTHNIDGAIELFQKALDRKPELARAHLELGLIYDSEQEDYIRAIYHYQRYLDLRPDAEKRPLIEDLVDRARLNYTTTLPNPPAGAIEEIAQLKRENRMLRHRLSEMKKAAVTTPAQPASPAPARASTAVAQRTVPARKALNSPKPAPAQPAVQTYRVQRGDTLSSIAAKMYNDAGQWKKIYEANKSTMKRPENLRVGQVLMIPR
jgi:tetratricopeptide (TPR) repeat protein